MPVDLVKGQKCRVTFEGYFDARDSDGETFFDDAPNGDECYGAAIYEQMPGFKVEAIEPDLVDLEVYRDADGDVFKYMAANKKFYQTGVSVAWSFDYPARPLTRLVPEGRS